MQLNDFERAALEVLLAGDDPILATLRAQAAHSVVASRDLTGVGFHCELAISADAPLAAGGANLEIGDVEATIDGLAHGAGLVLFVREGRLAHLECFTYDEAWPTDLGAFTLAYREEPRRLGLGRR